MKRQIGPHESRLGRIDRSLIDSHPKGGENFGDGLPIIQPVRNPQILHGSNDALHVQGIGSSKVDKSYFVDNGPSRVGFQVVPEGVRLSHALGVKRIRIRAPHDSTATMRTATSVAKGKLLVNVDGVLTRRQKTGRTEADNTGTHDCDPHG